MTSVAFGVPEDYAVVCYDRKVQMCVVVANEATHIPDALAVVNSLKMEQCLIIVPAGVDLSSLAAEVEAKVYNYVK